MNDNVTSAYVPPGWPSRVAPPGADGWLNSVTAHLLDCCPADYRAYPVLLRHPVVLAQLAQAFVESQLEATRRSLADVRVALGSEVDVAVLDDTVEVLQREGARLARTRRGIELVDQALRDVRFVPKL